MGKTTSRPFYALFVDVAEQPFTVFEERHAGQSLGSRQSVHNIAFHSLIGVVEPNAAALTGAMLDGCPVP